MSNVTITQEAFYELLMQVLPQAVEQTFGMPPAQITERFNLNDTLAQRATQAYAAIQLGLTGKEATQAFDKLTKHYNALPAAEQAKYTSDDSLLELWQSISDNTPDAPEAAAPKSDADGFRFRADGERLFSYDEAQEVLNTPGVDERLYAEVVHAYEVGAVEEPAA